MSRLDEFDSAGRHIDVDAARGEAHGYTCERCGKRHLSEAVWLELDSRTGRYHRPGEVPPDRSQGGFPFGRQCAEKALR